MSRKRRHADHEEHENHERWLITYADMITLMMAFFVMMYGMSILDIKKFDKFKAGAAKQLGKSPVMPGGQGILISGSGMMEAAAPTVGSGEQSGAGDAVEVRGEVDRQHVDKLVTEVRQRLAQQNLQNDTDVVVDPRGVVIYLRDKVLFASGSARMELGGLKILDQLSITLGHIDNVVTIEGHTDDRPIRTKQFPSNWELSTSRATQVLRWMVEARGLPAPRFSAAGYADTHPRVPNTTAENRAVNRRVEIVVVVPPEQEVPRAVTDVAVPAVSVRPPPQDVLGTADGHQQAAGATR